MYTNKQIWSVSYPILLSLLAQNVINVTDTAFLGRVSEIALGASAMGGLSIFVFSPLPSDSAPVHRSSLPAATVKRVIPTWGLS